MAKQRRELPPGGEAARGLLFDDASGGGPETKMSELFAPGKDSLVIYSFMFPRASFDERAGHRAVRRKSRLVPRMAGRDYKTVLMYADYQPDDRREADLVERVFEAGINSGINLSESGGNSEDRNRSGRGNPNPPDLEPAIS